MGMMRQSLIVTVVLLLTTNRAGAVNQGVQDVVVDQRMKVIELPIQVEGLTTFVFDTEVRHVFSPDKDRFEVYILEDLRLEQVKHAPLILKIAKDVPAGTRTNIIVMTDIYILSIRVRVTGARRPRVDLVNVMTDHSSPQFARPGPAIVAPALDPSAPNAKVRSADTRDDEAQSADARARPATTTTSWPRHSNRAGTPSVRIVQVQRPTTGTAYVLFEVDHLKARPSAAKVQLTNIHGAAVTGRVFWAADRDDSAHDEATAQGLVRIANAEKLSGQALTLTVSEPSGAWRVRIQGIQW